MDLSTYLQLFIIPSFKKCSECKGGKGTTVHSWRNMWNLSTAIAQKLSLNIGHTPLMIIMMMSTIKMMMMLRMSIKTGVDIWFEVLRDFRVLLHRRHSRVSVSICLSEIIIITINPIIIIFIIIRTIFRKQNLCQWNYYSFPNPGASASATHGIVTILHFTTCNVFPKKS